MTRKAVWAVCVALAVVASASKVIDLSSENFKATVESNKQTLVEFFAPWCGHCKALAPEYEKASLELEGKDAGVLAKVDCTEHKELCNQYEVRGFPTIKLFQGSVDSSIDYDQARKAEAIVKFMQKQAGPAVSVIAGAQAESFADGDEVKVIAFVSSGADETGYTTVAKKLRNDFNFALVRDDPTTAARFHVKPPGVVVRRKFDEGDMVFTGDWNAATFAADLEAFVKAQSFPLVGTIGPENYAKYVDRGLNFVWIFVDMNKKEQLDLVVNSVTPVARKHRNALSFVKLDGVRWAEHAKTFGLSGSKLPGIAIEDRSKSRNFAFPEGTTLNDQTFGAFVDEFVAGKLAPTIRSEPVPEKNDGPVKVVVGKTFDEIVLDNSKDVLVEFYAPWCGHCKSLAPKYDELGRAFAGEDNVVIAKIDATANDSPAQIQGFPTLLLYPAGDKANPVEYSGERSAKAMEQWVRETGKVAKKTGSNASHHHGHDHDHDHDHHGHDHHGHDHGDEL